MTVHTLEQEQRLPITLGAAWKFFSSPGNLDEITPGDLGFKIVHQCINNRWLIGTAGCNAMAALVAPKKLRSLDAWTEARSQTRMSGGVGGVTGAIPSPRPDSAWFDLDAATRERAMRAYKNAESESIRTAIVI